MKFLLFCLTLLSTFGLIATESLLLPRSFQISKKPQKPSTNKPAQSQTNPDKYVEEDEHMPKLVLAQFANMVASFFNIVQDPKNPKVLGPNLINILGGIVNIAVEGLRSGILTEEEATMIIRKATEILNETC